MPSGQSGRSRLWPGPRFPSKRQIEHLTSCPGRDQPIAHFNREDLPCFPAWWRNQVDAVHCCRCYLQPCRTCVRIVAACSASAPRSPCAAIMMSGVLSIWAAPEYAVTPMSSRMRAARRKSFSVSEPETKCTQVNVRHCNRRKPSAPLKEHYVCAFIGTDLGRDIVKDGFFLGKVDLGASLRSAAVCGIVPIQVPLVPTPKVVIDFPVVAYV